MFVQVFELRTDRSAKRGDRQAETVLITGITRTREKGCLFMLLPIHHSDAVRVSTKKGITTFDVTERDDKSSTAHARIFFGAKIENNNRTVIYVLNNDARLQAGIFI